MRVLDLSYHPLDVRSGGWVDLSRKDNHGTPYGGARPFQVCPRVMGVRTSSSSEYVEVSDDESLNFGTGGFSVGFWLYYTGSTTINKTPFDVLAKTAGGSNTPGWFSRVTTYDGDGSNYGILFSVTNGDWGTGNAEYMGAYYPNIWYYTVGVREGNTWSIYQNGDLRKQVTKDGIGANVNNSENLKIGKPLLTLGKGIIAQPVIENRAWSEAEVRENMYRSPIYAMLRGLPYSVYIEVPWKQTQGGIYVP